MWADFILHGIHAMMHMLGRKQRGGEGLDRKQGESKRGIEVGAFMCAETLSVSLNEIRRRWTNAMIIGATKARPQHIPLFSRNDIAENIVVR